MIRIKKINNKVKLICLYFVSVNGWWHQRWNLSSPLSIHNDCLWVLKSFIKYPVLTLIILFTGYGQLFALSYAANALATGVKVNTRVHYQASNIKATELSDLYIEEKESEEDEWFSLRVSPAINLYSPLFYSCLPAYFFQHIDTKISSKEVFSCLTFYKSPYLAFCVFRL